MENEDANLIVTVHAYSGNPDIYINPLTKPARKEDFSFQATGELDDRLIISPQEKRQNKAKTGLYHICIYGNHTSSYKLRVRERDADIYLADGSSETESIGAGATKTFWYSDESLSRDLTINIALTRLSGPTPSLYAKYCGAVEDSECRITDYGEPLVVEAISSGNREHL